MIQEIRAKNKRIRELEDKIEIYKQRETQIRETCEAWKKEVDIVRDQLEDKMSQQRTDHEAVVTTVKLSYDADLKRLAIENQELQGRIKATNENNELLRRQLLERSNVPNVEQGGGHSSNPYRPVFNQRGNQGKLVTMSVSRTISISCVPL